MVGLETNVTEKHAMVCFEPGVGAEDVHLGISDADLDLGGDVTTGKHNPTSQGLSEAGSAEGRWQCAPDALDQFIDR